VLYVVVLTRALHATRGVSRLVSFNGSPHIVPDDLVMSLQQQYSACRPPSTKH
jgi:hypothetical protein